MGGTQSKICKRPVNPDLYSVVTLSDSAVQKLPLGVEDTNVEREQRKQNIDDFWRDRLECLEQAFAEAKNLTENEFQRLEFSIKSKSNVGSGKPFCARGIDDTVSCYKAYPNETLNCRRVVAKLQLCLNIMMQEATKKKHEEFKRAQKQIC